MSLVRLLSAGKSLVGGQDLEGRYRLPANRALPEFGSAKNPFLTTAPVEAAPAVKPAEPVIPAPVVVPEPAPQVKADAPAEAKPGFFARLGHRLAGIGRWFRRKPKTVFPVFQRPPIQGELSLDRVRVLRNDLLDTDIEVVSRKKDTPKESRRRQEMGPPLAIVEQPVSPGSETKAPCPISNISRS